MTPVPRRCDCPSRSAARRSVAAVAVAAHETGHAIQDAHHEAGFRFRGALVPAVGFASNAWMPLVFLGFIFQTTGFS